MGHVDALSRCHPPSASEQGEIDEIFPDSADGLKSIHGIPVVNDEPMASDSKVDIVNVGDPRDGSIVAMVDSEDVDFQIRATQTRDPLLRELRRKLQQSPSAPSSLYELRDGLVCRKDRNRNLYSCVPSEMETELIRSVHEKIGHLSGTKCYEQIQNHYWFPEMKQKVDKLSEVV